MLCARAHLIFSDNSLVLKASLAFCRACRLLDMILLECIVVSVKLRLFVTGGSFGSLEMVDW